MAEFAEGTEDFYPNCFSDANLMGYSGLEEQSLDHTIAPMQQGDFHRTHIKEEAQSAVQASLSKKCNKRNKSGKASLSGGVEIMSHRRKRTAYAKNQLDILEEFFETNMYPNIHHREALAKLICIPESRIQVWFQNRRGKARREYAKSSGTPAVGLCYPNIRQPTQRTFPSAAVPFFSTSHQQHLASRHHQEDPLIHPEQSQLSPAQVYPRTAQRERTMIQPEPARDYHPNMPIITPGGNRQYLYKYHATPLIGYKKTMNMNGLQVPKQPNFMAAINPVPLKKVSTSKMTEGVPRVPSTSGNHGGMNTLSAEGHFQVTPMPGGSYSPRPQSLGSL